MSGRLRESALDAGGTATRWRSDESAGMKFVLLRVLLLAAALGTASCDCEDPTLAPSHPGYHEGPTVLPAKCHSGPVVMVPATK